MPIAGLAAFTLILPMTLAILIVMTFVVLSYREVVMVYIRPGGSYVVARENFGPRIAQICAVALLIDYVVTVAVQVAAGTAAVASAIPSIQPTSKNDAPSTVTRKTGSSAWIISEERSISSETKPRTHMLAGIPFAVVVAVGLALIALLMRIGARRGRLSSSQHVETVTMTGSRV